MGLVHREYLDSRNIVVCRQCRTHLTEPDEVISKEFQGQHGRAFLYATAINVVEGKVDRRNMTTGIHEIANIQCIVCESVLGWRYLKAFEPSQKYKVGHYILERSLVADIEQHHRTPSSTSSYGDSQ